MHHRIHTGIAHRLRGGRGDAADVRRRAGLSVRSALDELSRAGRAGG
ncbi:hypothetical protein [Actinophytocola sp.]